MRCQCDNVTRATFLSCDKVVAAAHLTEFQALGGNVTKLEDGSYENDPEQQELVVEASKNTFCR